MEATLEILCTDQEDMLREHAYDEPAEPVNECAFSQGVLRTVTGKCP